MLCDVQNFVVVLWRAIEWQQSKYSMKFELWVKNIK